MQTVFARNEPNGNAFNSESARGQVNRSAAEVYEEFFIPALFQEWPLHVAGAAQIQPGQRVLDVACGTVR